MIFCMIQSNQQGVFSLFNDRYFNCLHSPGYGSSICSSLAVTGNAEVAELLSQGAGFEQCLPLQREGLFRGKGGNVGKTGRGLSPRIRNLEQSIERSRGAVTV